MHLPGDETRSIDHATRKFKMFMPMTVSTPEWSLLYSSASDPVELFDLVKDPSQRHDVSARHPDVVRDLHGKLVRYLEEAQCPPEYLAPRRSVMV
jgi:arylsulfatase A-like enzyme